MLMGYKSSYKGKMFLSPSEKRDQIIVSDKSYQKATFAGGCFWCMVEPFQSNPGVLEVVSGYIGGEAENPTYEEVSAGNSGHIEAVQVTFDPQKVNYGELVDIFWRQIDPTDAGGQFGDRGSQYITAIFYHDAEQKKLAEAAKQELELSKQFKHPIVTQIIPASPFYPAEDYHQDFYLKSPAHYNRYSSFSGRAKFIAKNWDQAAFNNLEKTKRLQALTPLQYKVTQEEGTEPPFNNEYWDNDLEGIYVDIVSGEPLFSSKDKYDSGTGWPSFIRPIQDDNIVTKKDRKLFMSRVEVRSKEGDSHLGHVFTDGPKPTALRYCMNSAALRFIPVAEMADRGYAEYLRLF